MINIAYTIKYALRCAFILDRKPYPYEKWLYYFAHFYQTPGLLIENINNILYEIKSNQKRFMGPESQNNISQESRIIRQKLISKANQIGIHDLWLEKWWRFIDKSREGILNLTWGD